MRCRRCATKASAALAVAFFVSSSLAASSSRALPRSIIVFIHPTVLPILMDVDPHWCSCWHPPAWGQSGSSELALSISSGVQAQPFRRF